MGYGIRLIHKNIAASIPFKSKSRYNTYSHMKQNMVLSRLEHASSKYYLLT